MLNPTWWLQIWPLPNMCSDSVTLRERATLPHPGIRMMATVVCNYPWPRWIVTTATDYQTEPDQTQSWGKPRRNGSWTNFAPTNQCSWEKKDDDRLKRLHSLFFCPLYCAVFFFCFETFGGASLAAENKRDKLLFYEKEQFTQKWKFCH